MDIKTSKRFSLILFLIMVLTVCLAGFYQTTFYSKAQSTSVDSISFLPQTDLENTALENASAVYRDKNLTAIIEDNHKFTIHFADKSIVVSDNKNILKDMLDVKLFDSNTLFFSANARLYAYDLQNNTYSKVVLNGSEEEPVSYFDFNDNYLITTYQSTCKIFTIDNGVFTSHASEIPIFNGSNVSISNNDQLFMVGVSGIYQTSAITPAVQTNTNTLTSATPSQIISNDNFVYYVLNSTVYSISIHSGISKELSTLPSDNAYDLGKINSAIKYISFCNDNLLVVQNDCIQEYKINNDGLAFTGFAIANGKTAYNRIGVNATDIEKSNNRIAVLDSYKLTVYLGANSHDRYARENYKNYFVSALEQDNVLPSSFALGEQNALLLYNSNSSNKFVALLDFSKQDSYLIKQPYLGDHSVIHDICYQSGYYYILCDNGNAPQHVYRASANSNAQTLNFEQIDANTSTTEFTMFAVDTYSNIYLANSTSIKKLSSGDGYAQLTDIGATFSNIKKLQTDLLGKVYVLDNGVIKSVEDNAIIDYSLSGVKAFAFDFVDDNAFFLLGGSEFICQTTDLDNVSIADLIVPDDFNLTFNSKYPTTANDNLQFFKAKEGANAYVVKPKGQSFVAGENFIFSELSNYSDEYVQICTIMHDGEQRFYALANQHSIVLMDISQAQNTNKQPEDIVKDAFVATDVCCYYLPIISQNGEFCLSDNRIKKTTKISVKKKLSFLDRDYYYAEFELGNITYNGYIPCDFTVDVLTDDFEWEQFSLGQVNKTQVYRQDDMQESIFELAKDSTIRVIERNDTICKIAYKNGDVWEIGYIYSNKIINQPALAIRNILIILAVVASICGTCIFFLLRKKKIVVKEPNRY